MLLKIKLKAQGKRNRYKEKAHSDYVASVLGRHYDDLKQRHSSYCIKSFDAFSHDDIFQETMLYVIQDPKAFNMSETEILEHFSYRYNMINFQIVNDSKMILKMNQDANNIQASEESDF